jgi:hypothetical protein
LESRWDGQEAAVILGGDPTEPLLGDTAATHEGVDGPPARDLLADLRDPTSRSMPEGRRCRP